MRSHLHLAAAFVAAIIAVSAGAAFSQTLGAKVTQARNLHASRATATLSGDLFSSDGCHAVRFFVSPMQVFPPVYIAQQYPAKHGMCMMVVRWLPAKISIPARARYVTVNTANGSEKVPVR